jgi:hypothetical protein
MKQPRRLLYQPNRLGYSLMLLFIVSAGIYLVFTLKSMTVNQAIAYVSLVNIVAILFAFLVAVKIKFYSRIHQFSPFFLAILLGVQVLNIPAGVIESDLTIVTFAGFAAVFFALASGIVSVVKNTIRRRFIHANNIKDTHLSH